MTFCDFQNMLSNKCPIRGSTLCDRRGLIIDEPSAAPSRSSRNRSRISNGTALLAGVDGRSPSGRRYRDILDSLLSQLDRAPTESDLILCRHAADLAVWTEQEAAKRLRGEPSIDTTTATNTLRRVLADLGLSQHRSRRPRIKTNPRPALSHLEASR